MSNPERSLTNDRETKYERSGSALFDNLYTIENLSKFLNVPAGTIRDWVYKRQIPFQKLGRLIRFHPLDIQKWLNERSHYVD